MNELALFAGAGGGILGGRLLGWRTVCAVELNPYAASVLLARQNDGTFPAFPVWDDIRTFDGRPWRGLVEVISGGFPCQDISVAGSGEGIDGARSGLWSEFARIIREVGERPGPKPFVFVENSPALTSRGLGTVLGDLAAMGYDAEWGVLGAHHLDAPHKRDRIWIVAADRSYIADADHESIRQNHNEGGKSFPRKKDGHICGGNERDHISDADRAQRERGRLSVRTSAEYADTFCPSWWSTEPNVGRVAHGIPRRMDRLRALGNAVVPQVAEHIGRIIMEAENDR